MKINRSYFGSWEINNLDFDKDISNRIFPDLKNTTKLVRNFDRGYNFQIGFKESKISSYSNGYVISCVDWRNKSSFPYANCIWIFWHWWSSVNKKYISFLTHANPYCLLNKYSSTENSFTFKEDYESLIINLRKNCKDLLEFCDEDSLEIWQIWWLVDPTILWPDVSETRIYEYLTSTFWDTIKEEIGKELMIYSSPNSDGNIVCIAIETQKSLLSIIRSNQKDDIIVKPVSYKEILKNQKNQP